MNILYRNKKIIQDHARGKKFVSQCREYGISTVTMSHMYYNFRPLIDRPWYDAVAGIELKDQVAVKLANALAKYEVTHNVELTPEYIADHMDMANFRRMRGVGTAIESALMCVQLHIRKGRA